MNVGLRDRLAQINFQIASLERQLDALRAERTAHILDLHDAGATLGAIGNATGLTRQRVLQIIQRYGVANGAK